IVELIERGEAVSFGEISLDDETVDNFFRHYFPVHGRHVNTYQSTVYTDEWEPKDIAMQTLTGTGECHSIDILDTGETVSAYKWINQQCDRPYAHESLIWMRIEDGILSWYSGNPDEETGVQFVLNYILKDKKLTELELETITVEAGTFQTLKITTYSPVLYEWGEIWLAPEVGMVKYRGDQEVMNFDTGEFLGYFRYGLELVSY
ncbi:MAG: hypothetical protein GX986_10105, partial [Firmicutes bacterium]|nr:hypothetical protein [Bacillota bacterium]